MKIILQLFLIMGLLCSTNSQADEITNYDALFDTPDVGLSIDQADFDAINTDNYQRFDLRDDGCSRLTIGSQESRYSEPIRFDIEIVSHTHLKEIGGSNIITTAKRQSIESFVPLRRAGETDTDIRKENYRISRNQYAPEGDPDRDKEKQNQLVDTGQMAGYRGIGIQGNGHRLKTH